MTKKRIATLVTGVLVLGLLSLWKLNAGGDDLPSEPAPPERGASEGAPSQPPSPPADAHLAVFDGESMGATYHVKYVPPHAAVVDIAPVVAEAALAEVVASMSNYEATSEITVFNSTPVGTPFHASPDFFEVIQLSAELYAVSDGAFDVTVRPLVKLYGFGSDAEFEPPLPGVIEVVRARVGMDKLTLDAEKKTLTKTVEGVELDLDGIAKGYGVDRVALALEKLGIESYMVEVGGEIRVRGEKKEGAPWLLAIEEPVPHERKLHITLSLAKTGAALATSGDYRNFRSIDGKVVSHTFDPRSAAPVPRRTASVSIIRPSAAEADGLATALFVLEPERAISLANEKGWPVYMLLHRKEGGFEVKMSEAFKQVDWQRASARVTPPREPQ